MSEPTPAPTLWRRLASRVVRLTCLGLTVLLGLYTVRTYQALLRGPAPAATAATAPAIPVERLGSAALGEGFWQLGSGRDGLGMERCTADKLAARLDRLPAEDAPDGVLGGWTASLCRQRGSRRERCRSGWKYLTDLPTMRARIFTRDRDRRERWIATRLGYSIDDGKWIVLEMKPKGAAAGHGAPILLPVPPGSQVVARRVDAAGRISAELVQIPASVAALRSFWEQQGCPAQGAALADGIVCRWKNEDVQVWGPAGTDEVGLVFLIRARP